MATEMVLSKIRSELKNLFLVATKTVSPKRIIQDKVKLENDTLYVGGNRYPLREKVYLVGFGKAVMSMAVEMEKILGNRLVKGIVSVPDASKDSIWKFDETSSFPNQKTTVVEYHEGAVNNQPDDRAWNTTHEILDLVETLTDTDTLIVLISGGGSALLYMPRPTIDSEDKMRLCRELQNAGANITEVNIVRRKLSMVKGGGLARMAYPATIITLIMSDIIGDPIDLIASGPTVYNPKAPEEVLAVIRKYNLQKLVEGDLRSVIVSAETFKDEALLNPEKQFKHVSNIILANNMTAVEGAQVEAYRQKLVPIVLRNDIQGDVHDVSLAYAHITNLVCLALNKTLSMEDFTANVNKSDIIPLTADKVKEIYCLIHNVDAGGVVLIGAGEPTVKVTGNGKGGRNQELALYFSLDWLAKVKSNPQLAAYDVVLFSGGTDGQDGPTDAAGAFGYPAFAPIAHKLHEILKLLEIEKLTLAQLKKQGKKTTEVTQQDLCKRYILSDYLTPQSVKSTNEESNKIEKEDDSELLDDVEYEKKYKLELMIMEVERMLPENALNENDSYNFFSRFKKGKDLVKTGFTGTNVMDLHFIYIKKRNCTCEIYPKEGDLTEISLDDHDLHIDPETIRRHRSLRMHALFKKDIPVDKTLVHKVGVDQLNIKIIDENLRDPCCNKQRKSPKSSD
ncbi:hypothetical protein KPH14_009714 [Odynerus spinipes]|uniref:Glycerate kinase n=1 Tax=Odynerus spinipes TaxID=1348599 RepID=A0AAD9VQX5_9HYME|nr:hypothetical protein KPH14_009714 [Odynerus spinipes]